MPWNLELRSGWVRARTRDPAGLLASDFLTEAFLLPVDLKLQKLRGYLRYVDDIRLFGSTEDEVAVTSLTTKPATSRAGSHTSRRQLVLSSTPRLFVWAAEMMGRRKSSRPAGIGMGSSRTR